MDNSKLISIIVPVYNVEQYLERSVNSILKQTYTNLEIILVDDGAKDSSGKMCDELSLKDSRIKVVHKKNGGLSDARNAGLQVATGDYIGYVDSDDWIEPDMYESMLKACLENNAEVCICKYFEEHKDFRTGEGSGKITAFSKEELIKAYVEDNDDYVIYNSVWSKLFKKELVEGVLFPVGRNSEDIMYTTRAFCKAERGAYIDKPFYHYVIDREGSIMNEDHSDRMFKDEIPFWREHIKCISEKVSGEMGDLAAYFFYRRMLSYFIDLSDKNSKASEIIAKMMLKEKKEVKRVYKACRQSRGDSARMKLFLISPSLYKNVNKLYLEIAIKVKK